jgi:N6-L-threonylcarbamoyladenine synthase
MESGSLSDQHKADLCASFQHAALTSLVDRMHNAIAMFKTLCPTGDQVVVAGGVAANQFLRAGMQEVAATHGMSLTAPPIALCTDNAAMIAWAGLERFALGHTDSMDFEPRARWPLAQV